MKFEVKDRFSSDIKFIAEIECDKDESRSVKLGLAVRWRIKNFADLRSADLRSADLTSANLSSADLRSADLRFADLRSANLRFANLRSADLRSADLTSADLRLADLSSADLRFADLRSANLRSANLRSANLTSANLRKTILDPEKPANEKIDGFEMDENGNVFGYRTRKAGHIDRYRDGWTYSADFFSVCEKTECHPGLYLWPTLEMAQDYSGKDNEFIKVIAPVVHVHKAGSKWRCRWFTVIGKSE